MWLSKLAVGVVGVALVASCARSAADDGAGGEPQIFATGTLVGAQASGEPMEWALAEIDGFSHAVSLNVTTTTRVASQSASRQGPDDHLWFVAADLGEGEPVVVFGGAGPGVDDVVLVDTEGRQLQLDLDPVPGREWSLAMVELPPTWSGARHDHVDVVALAGGVEMAREALPGLD